jgi:O-antigen/teichoic acid export membrane protein
VPGLRRPVVAGVLGKVAEAATLVLLATVVPRLLGPVDYGRLSVALTLVAVGSVAMTLGGATLLARYVPAAPAEQRRGLARALTLRLARNRLAPFGLLVAVGAVPAAGGPFPPQETVWVLLALALNVVATLALQADLGLGRAGAWSARYPVQNAVLIGAVVVLYGAAGVDGAIAGVAVAGAAGLALAVAATAPLWRAAPRVPIHLPPDAARFGLVAAGTGALTQLVQRGGVVAAAVLSTEEETGHAAVAIGVALAATYAVAQVFVVTLPALTARQADGAAEPALRRLAGVLLAGALPVVALAVLAVGVAVPVVLGAAYADAVAAFPVALAAVVLAPLNALLLQAAALRLRPEATLMAAAAGAVVFVAVAVLAVPAWGAAGAAGAALAGTAAAGIAGVVAVPGAAGWRLVTASFAGAVAVMAWGVLA